MKKSFKVSLVFCDLTNLEKFLLKSSVVFHLLNREIDLLIFGNLFGLSSKDIFYCFHQVKIDLFRGDLDFVFQTLLYL